MTEEVTILIADDDDGHTVLIKKNLLNAGINNKIIRFENGQLLMDFLNRKGKGQHRENNRPYLILLDIRMPILDGVQALKQIKIDEDLRKIPVVMLTTTKENKEIENCHKLGCSNFIVKPIEYDKFVEVIKQLGLFFKIVEIPNIRNNN